MRRLMLTSLMVCGAWLIGAQVQAQAPAAAPAAGGTADGTPFDIPYGTPINLETAKKLVAAVEAEATKHRWKLNIAVVDPNGDLIHFSRMDGAPLSASPGGYPLVEGGKLIGAIGCSGGTGDQDAAACKVGVDLVK